MSRETDVEVLQCYRSVCREEPSAALDCNILAAARRRALFTRSVRHGSGLLAILLGTVAAFALSRRIDVVSRKPLPVVTDPVARDYGLQAGATRYYLLTVSAIPPGSIDWR